MPCVSTCFVIQLLEHLQNYIVANIFYPQIAYNNCAFTYSPEGPFLLVGGTGGTVIFYLLFAAELSYLHHHNYQSK